MASRPSPRAAAPKKIATYGSSSRRKHSNIMMTQSSDAPCPSSRKSPSPTERQPAAASLDHAQRIQGRPKKAPTDHKGPPGETQSGRKRKRDDSATHVATIVPDRGKTLDNKQKVVIRASGDLEERPTSGAENRPHPPAQHRTPSKGTTKAPGGDASRRVPSALDGRETPPASRRRRLIDALTAQRGLSPDEEMTTTTTKSLQVPGDEADSPLPPRTASRHDLRSRAVDRRGATPTSRKIKLTYSQSRSVLSEPRGTDNSDPFGPEVENSTGFAETSPLPKPPEDDPGDGSADDDVDDSPPAIKSVHELRRSGANNRFADEMDDLLSRISTPGTGSLTMRRNALCELAQSLPNPSFAEQFRDHASRDNVAKSIGREQDVVSGFALAAALVIFLKSGPAPHLVRQLSLQGLGRFLGRLLRESEDIDNMAKQRTMNLSPTARKSVQSLKSTLMRMPIWRGLEPIRLSPRTLGLQLLETVARCADEQLLERVATDSSKDLVNVAVDCADAEAPRDAVDYALAVFSLELLSSAGVATGHSLRGPSETQLSRSIATFLRSAMERWPRDRGEVEAATLKLAINTTNTEKGAAAFADPDLMSVLADGIGSGYRRVQKAIGSGPLEGGLYDELVLLLGIMINIVEHSPPVRACVRKESLDGLVALWHENRQIVSEADSVDKSKVSVALGYLAVLLGYLCLTPRGRERVKARFGNGEGIRSLIESIRDFVAMYKTVDSKVHELEALVNELRSHDARGQSGEGKLGV